MSSRMISAREVAEILGVHVNTVKRMPPSELAYFRIGTGKRQDRRYLVSEVDAFLDKRRVEKDA